MLTPSSRLLGARRSLMALAERLDPERWRPVVCAQSPGQLGEELARRGIEMHTVRLGWWRKAKYFIWRPFAIARLAALARQVDADLIHCNEIYPNPYAVRAARGLGEGGRRAIPVVTHVRLGLKPGMLRKYDLGRADRIVVASRSLLENFSEWPGRDQRVSVVYNGVDLDEFQRSRTPEAARLQIGLPKDICLIGAIGQVGPRKGGDVLLSAFERVAREYPQAHLMFLGDPHRGQESFADELRRRVAGSGLTERVHFFPFSDKVLPYYEATDINVLVSRDEGFGRTIIEAGALGIPSIGARVGGIQEIIVDGRTGRLVEVEDPQGLAEALRELLADAKRRRELGEDAFRRAVQYFSIKAHADGMMDLFDDVLAAFSGRRED